MTKGTTSLASLLVLVAVSFHARSNEQAATAAQLQAVYGKYNEALLQKHGDEAAQLLHPDLVRIYADALSLARTADAQTLKSAPLHQRLIALYARWQAPPEVLKTGDPTALIAFMVREGVLRSDSGVSIDLRDFTITDDEATAFLYRQGRKTPMRVRFAPVDDQWKIDLTQLQTLADDIYKQMAVRQQISEDQTLLNLISAYTRRPVTEEIWQPLDR